MARPVYMNGPLRNLSLAEPEADNQVRGMSPWYTMPNAAGQVQSLVGVIAAGRCVRKHCKLS